MSNRYFECTTCNDNSPITFVADDELVPLYNGIQSGFICGLNSDASLYEGFIFGDGFNNVVTDIVTQDDGKIIVVGGFTSYNGNSTNRIIRLNPDGTVDNQFIYGTGFNATVQVIVLQPDGKILIGGDFTSYKGVSVGRIIRLNSNGSIDDAFVTGTGFGNGFVATINLQPDGTMIVGGNMFSYDGNSINGIVKLGSNGSIDNTFITGSGFDNIVFTFELQSDGKILVGGMFTNYNGTTTNYIVRLNSNGSIDNTFVTGFGFNAPVHKILISSNGKILVCGQFTDYNGTTTNFIVRLNSNGSIDNTFVTGSGFDNVVNTFELQSDGKIVVGGSFNSYDGNISSRLVRLTSNGSFDSSFDVGDGFDNDVNTIQIQNNQTLLIGGYFTNYKKTIISNLIRLNISGLYDNSLRYYFGPSGSVRTISIQDDEKIILGGDFQNYENVPVNYIVRINSDGTLDNTFNLGTGFNNVVNTTIIQSDGKILVGGEFNDYDGGLFEKIIRLNSDGSVEGTFNIGSGFDGPVFTIDIQQDNKIIVGGNFSDFDGNQVGFIARLNANGTFDNTFVTGIGFDDIVYDVKIQSDGKILVVGDFTNYDSNTIKRIIRLNTDGSIDVGFNVGGGLNGEAFTVDIQTDGKIIVGGDFSDYDGIPANKIVRINTDGTIDNTFVNGIGFNGVVRDVKIQDDGKILVVGDFEEYNGTGAKRIIRLNSDGSIDGTFVYGTGFNSEVYTIAIQSDNKILVGGVFNEYPLRSGVFQLVEGNCVTIDSYGVVSRGPSERFFTFGPFISCSECTTPDDSSGIESIICVSCDDPESVTGTTVPHGIYLDERGRAIAQINTVGMGGFNGLNN
jgi:uncharacterized delta-60 repeat protein